MTRTGGPDDAAAPTLVTAQRDTVMLLYQETGTIDILEPGRRQPSRARAARRVPGETAWFLFSPREVFGYRPGGELALVYRSGATIVDVAALDSHGTLAVATTDEIFILFSRHTIQHTLRHRPAKFLTADQEQRRLYFADETGIWQLRY